MDSEETEESVSSGEELLICWIMLIIDSIREMKTYKSNKEE